MKHNRKILLTIVIAVLFVGVAAALIVRQRDRQADSLNKNNSSSGGVTSPGTDKPDSSAPVTTPLTNNGPAPRQPSGSFVSSHNTKLNYALESACSTTPGATCDIVFTKGGLTKSLGAKTTNATGDAIWNWTPKDLGVTEGSWQISAVASLNGKTATTEDPIALQVSP